MTTSLDRSADKADKGTRLDVLAASAIVNLLGLALPIVLLQVYDRIIPRGATGTLAFLCFGLLVAVMLELLVRSARTALLGWAGARFEHRTRMRALEHALSCDLDAFEKQTPGTYLERMTGIEKLREHRAGEGALAWIDLPFVFVYLGVLAWISPLLAIWSALAMIMVFCVGTLFGKHITRLWQIRSQIEAQRFSFIIEVLRAIEPVKSLGLEAAMERRYERLMRKSALIGHDIAVASHVSSGLNATLSQACTFMVAMIGAGLVMDSAISVGALASALLLVNRVVQPLLALQAHRNLARQARACEEKMSDFLALPAVANGSIDPGPIETIGLRGASYGRGPDTKILDRVDFELRVGEIVSIDGANGSGKSTLMWLLAGVLQPGEGAVTINGTRAMEFDARRLRSQIALLTHKTALLSGSIIDNLTRFDPKANLDEAVALAAALGLDRTFGERPEGLLAKVASADQSGLPPSVAQRLALVRALIGRPRVILFDEANIGLDHESDRMLKAYLETRRNDAAIVLVTQRPSYRNMADRHYSLANGRLVERNDAVAAEQTSFQVGVAS